MRCDAVKHVRRTGGSLLLARWTRQRQRRSLTVLSYVPASCHILVRPIYHMVCDQGKQADCRCQRVDWHPRVEGLKCLGTCPVTET